MTWNKRSANSPSGAPTFQLRNWSSARSPNSSTGAFSRLLSLASEKTRHLWRQSEVMLRMAQSREPNRPGRHGNGLIVASMPDGVWFTPWVRDMAWATVALTRMGHREEARAALLAYFNARPTGKDAGGNRRRRLPDLGGALLSGTVQRSHSLPRKAAPILSSTTGVKPCGCSANT